jgi:endonuclease YncB( thermonuclease family)
VHTAASHSLPHPLYFLPSPHHFIPPTFSLQTAARSPRCIHRALIAQVVSGSTLRILLLPGFHQITLMLSGIACGGIKRLEDGTEEAAPFAREARFFVESRLLNRDVQVKLEGVDKNGSLLGTAMHPQARTQGGVACVCALRASRIVRRGDHVCNHALAGGSSLWLCSRLVVGREGAHDRRSSPFSLLSSQGNMSIELVKLGLARVADWSSHVCDHAPALRAAERAAKEKRLRLWRDYVPPNMGSDSSEFVGRVVEVVSGDTLVSKYTFAAFAYCFLFGRTDGRHSVCHQVVADPSGTERRVSLSSLRCPRLGKEPEPYAAEAKELLRKLTIGKKVVVKPEYKKSFAPEGAAPSERTFVTVLYNTDKNAAEALLTEGLATVAKYGQVRCWRSFSPVPEATATPSPIRTSTTVIVSHDLSLVSPIFPAVTLCTLRTFFSLWGISQHI